MGSESCGGVGVKDYRSGVVSVDFSSRIDSSNSFSTPNGIIILLFSSYAFEYELFILHTTQLFYIFLLNCLYVSDKIEFVFVCVLNRDVNCGLCLSNCVGDHE